MELSPVPVWLLDIDATRVCWANAAALELWQADSAKALSERDMVSAAPPKILARLERIIAAVRAGQILHEEWAFYPRGVPTMVLLHLRGVTLADGRLTMLNQALPLSTAAAPSLVRGITALRHTRLIIAFVTSDGYIQMQNPAAMETFPMADSWLSWLASPETGGALLAQALRNETVQVELPVVTKAGPRFHAIALYPLRDPVSGQLGALIEHTDITTRIEAEATASERLRMVERQRQEILVLAAPVLDVGHDAIAVPVIGELDTERCQELAKRLLQALVERRARRAILDLTGVSGLDSAGVAALYRLIESIRLLGATPIITGIGAELAQRLTRSGSQLPVIVTRRSLADAINHLSLSQS